MTESVGGGSGDERPDEVPQAVGHQVDEALGCSTDPWPGLLVRVDLSRDEEEVVAHPVQDDSHEHEGDQGPRVSKSKRQVPRAPGRHRHQENVLDAVALEQQRQGEHEEDLPDLAEALNASGRGGMNVVQVGIGERVVELQGNAEQERKDDEYEEGPILEEYQGIEAERVTDAE